MTRDLLARLRLPNDCAISVRCTILDSSPTRSFLNPALSRYRETLQYAGKTHRIKIGITRTGFRLIAADRRRHISLYFVRTPAVRDALEWFGINTESGNDMESHSETLPEGVVAPHSDPSVTLELAESARKLLGFDHLASVLDLRCITKIKMTRLCPQKQTAVLSYLSKRHASVQQMPTTASPNLPGNGGAIKHRANVRPFPGLRNLVVNGSKDHALKDVIDYVRSRSGDGTVAGAPEASARLKRIEFVDESPGAIRNGSVTHPKEACWDLLSELLDLMDNDVEVCWHGERIFKAGTME
ncbi:hypothetical protein M407DRAFT_18155 [Tulasnella calospora MUT 4182]|uniref:Uncharacterized protein n=1 Tax=Tulasnella calospora MUT 4182 TaxID=1051891 RepID=A0A0C3LG97_9AGAM|nr:hypothetical protein M407DRAFT_18155 [Tulasnella calospora MUT 4182]